MVMEPEPEPRAPRPSRSDPPSWLGGEPQRADSRSCAFCGESAPPGSSFCPHCGRGLTKALRPGRGQSLTVLFTDIEDSSQLTERLGDTIWEGLLEEHEQIVRGEVQRHGGFEVKQTGDGFLIVHSDPLQAVQCAARTQSRVMQRADEAGAAWPVRVRMGIHSGNVTMRPDGDILGQTVNEASRILAKGRGGEIMTSSEFAESLAGERAGGFFRDAGRRRIRGRSRRMHLYRFDWPGYLDADPAALDGIGLPDFGT